jgi:uncharacterized protein YacL (UPF0231 family)
MLNTENINKLNNLLDQLGEVKEELAKINNLKKRQRLIEKTIKAILIEHEENIYVNSEWQVTIDKAIKDKITEDKILEIIELFDANQLDSLCYEDFVVPKESISMKIKKISKEEK